MTNQQRAYIFALAAVLLWSTVATAFKIALRYMNFLQLLFFATAASVVILFVILLVQRKLPLLLAQRRSAVVWSAIGGALNPFAYYLILLKGYSLLPAQMAQPLNYLWPIVLVLLSAPFLHQKIRPRSLVALIVSFVGVAFISSGGQSGEVGGENNFGVLLCVSSSVVWAVFWLVNVRDRRDEAVKLLMNFVFGLLYIALLMGYHSAFEGISVQGLAAAVYVGFFEMGLTFFLWLKAMQLTTSTDRIGNLVFLSPFVSLIFISVVLGETIYATTIAGLLFIVGGIAVQRYKA